MVSDMKPHPNDEIVARLRNLSPEDLAELGVQDVAYVKRVVINGKRFCAVHSAAGQQMVLMEDRETAVATVHQYDLEPLSVH